MYENIIIAIMQATLMTRGNAEILVENYCMNKAYTLKQEIHYQLCDSVWEKNITNY